MDSFRFAPPAHTYDRPEVSAAVQMPEMASKAVWALILHTSPSRQYELFKNQGAKNRAHVGFRGPDSSQSGDVRVG